MGWDLNVRVGEVANEGKNSRGHGLPGVYETGGKLIESCAERGILVGNTWFKMWCIHTWVTGVGGQRPLMDCN